MTQEHVHDRIEAYLDGELDAAASARVEQHVRACTACREEMEELQALQERLLHVQVPDPGPAYWSSFANRVEARLQPAGARAPARRWERLAGWFFPAGRLAWPRAVGALASVTLLMFLGLRGFRHEAVREVDRFERQRAAPQAPAAGSLTPEGRGAVDVVRGEAPGQGAAKPRAEAERQADLRSGGVAALPATGTRDAKEEARAQGMGSTSTPVFPPVAKFADAPVEHAVRTPDAARTDVESGAPGAVPEAPVEGSKPGARESKTAPAQLLTKAAEPGSTSQDLSPKDSGTIEVEGRSFAGLRTQAETAEKDIRVHEPLAVRTVAPPPPAPSAPPPPAPSLTESPRGTAGSALRGGLQVPGALGKAKQSAPEPPAPAAAEQRVSFVIEAPYDEHVARFVSAALAGDSVAARDVCAQLESQRFGALDAGTRSDMQQWLAIAQANRVADESRSAERSAGMESARKAADVEGSAGTAADVRALLVLDRLIWSRRGSPAFAAPVASLAEQLAAHAGDLRARERAREYLQYLVSSSGDASDRRHWEALLQKLPR